MGRSLWFRVYDHVLNALFRLAFAAAPPLQLNLARDRNSPVHSTKARHHPLTGSDYCRHTVSGSLSLPSGCFSLSLTVLVHYRSLGFSLGRWSSQIPTEFHVFRRTQDTFKRTKFRLRGCYPLRRTFRSLRLPRSFVTPYRMSYNPKRQASWFGLCSVSLAATQEIAFAFSSSGT